VTGALAAVSAGAAGFAYDPSISADGRFVAFATRPWVAGARPAYRRGSVWRHDRATGRTELVSRRDGRAGGAAGGLSNEPSVSADGTRIAFTSTAGDLAAGKPAGLAGVVVRDLAAGTTRLVSRHAVRRDPPAAEVRAATLGAVARPFGPCLLHEAVATRAAG
jgi:Tol biopolymer transport system component